MTYKETFTIDGEERTVTFTRPGGIAYLHTAASMPQHIEEASEQGENPEMTPEAVEWYEIVIKRTSNLSNRQLNKIPVSEVGELINVALTVFAGQDPDRRSSEQFRVDSNDPFDPFDLDDDGSVDPGDWR